VNYSFKPSLYVNKSLHLVCSLYKAIESLQKIWNKPVNSYGLVKQSLYELFEASKWFLKKIFIKNIFICVLKMNESLTGLKWHAAEKLMTEFNFLGELSL